MSEDDKETTSDNSVVDFIKQAKTARASLRELDKAVPSKRGQGKKKASVAKLPKTQLVDYNLDKIHAVLDAVFPEDELREDEHIAVYHSAAPKDANKGYAISTDKLFKTLKNAHGAARLYFTTSTIKQDAKKHLRHKRENFVRMWLVVLDDVGTDIPISRVPTSAIPTYIIETSKGNYQYGYALSEPIEDYTAAKTLIDLVKDAGLTDKGGAMPLKKVRLPESIHGKPDSKDFYFQGKLTHCDPSHHYTPQTLLDALQINVKWADVEEDAIKVQQQRVRVNATLAHSPQRDCLMSINGTVDPVLEWLSDNGKIIDAIPSDTGYIEIECPWHEDHGEGGGISAGYVPLGLDPMFPETRNFNCFHKHGATYKTGEFLEYVRKQNGPDAARVDPVPNMVRRYVFDSGNSTYWQITETDYPQPVGAEAFKLRYAMRIPLVTKNKKGEVEIQFKTLWDLYLQAPNRVNVIGTSFDPRNTSRIITDKYGETYLNTFTPFDFGGGDYDRAQVAPFLEHIEFLIPDEEERELFLDWIAAQLQDMSFRGWGIVMIAQGFGVGRGTLNLILRELFTHHNLTEIGMKKFLGIDAKDNWNEYEEKGLVIVGEASNMSGGPTRYYEHFETVKEKVDQIPRVTEINHKGTTKTYDRTIYTSYLLQMNDSSNFRVPEDDRRLYVIRNPSVDRFPHEYKALHKWVDARDAHGGPIWRNDLGRYFLQRTPDKGVLQGRAPMTEGKRSLVRNTQTAADVALEALMRSLDTPFITTPQAMKLLSQGRVLRRLGFADETKGLGALRRMIGAATVGAPALKQIRVNGGAALRPLIFKARQTEGLAPEARTATAKNGPAIAAQVRMALDSIDEKVATTAILEALETEGFII